MRIAYIDPVIDRLLKKMRARRLKQRRDLLGAIRARNQRAVMAAQTEMGLRHWHNRQRGILIGTRASGCPLC